MQARIFKLTKSPTQSAKVQDIWILECICQEQTRFKEPLMLRTSTSDMASEVKLKFNNLETAINFARSKNYDFEIISPKEHKIRPKNYASNFC